MNDNEKGARKNRRTRLFPDTLLSCWQVKNRRDTFRNGSGFFQIFNKLRKHMGLIREIGHSLRR